MRKTLHPPPPQTTPTFEIQNQNKGIEDIMDIDSNCPSLLFGVSEGALFNIFLKFHTPPRFFFYTNFFFNVGNSMKHEENLKY